MSAAISLDPNSGTGALSTTGMLAVFEQYTIGVQEPAQSRQRRVTAYAAIKDQILARRFGPTDALSEYKLAALLGMSRTPIREALKQLEQEGLVRVIPRKGVFVAEISVADIHEIYQVRQALECFAATVAAQRMEDTNIESLIRVSEEAAERLAVRDPGKAFEFDINLHQSIIKSTRNQRLAAILATLKDQVHRLRLLSVEDVARVSRSLAEHRAILEAIRSRDSDAAAAAMRTHMRNARDSSILLAVPTSGIEEIDGDWRTALAQRWT